MATPLSPKPRLCSPLSARAARREWRLAPSRRQTPAPGRSSDRMAARIMVDDSRGAVASAGGWSLGDSDFAFLSDFVYKHCGIVLGEHKRQLVQGRLLRRLRALDLDGFDAYVDLLR